MTEKPPVIKCLPRAIDDVKGNGKIVFGGCKEGMKFWCPFCKTWHLHGRGPGYRAPHCKPSSPMYERDYYIKMMSKAELKRNPKGNRPILRERPAMTEQPTTPESKQPNFIKDPFITEKDYDKLPVEQVPEEIRLQNVANYRHKLQEQKDQLKQIELGLVNLSQSPEIESLLLIEAHRTLSAYDDHIIKVVFHTGLSAYLKPLNLGLKAESGAGKSYSTMEALKFLPNEDIEIIGSQSPKVISHQLGVKKTPEGDLIGEAPEKPKAYEFDDDGDFKLAGESYKILKKQYDERNEKAIYEVDLRGRIYVFLENFNVETFKMFKATMSNDNPWIDHKFVDDKGTVHITRLVGAPAIIYNCVDSEYLEEQATRSLTATPSDRTEKHDDAMRISNEKSCYPWQYETEHLNKLMLKEYIRKIKFFVQKGNLKVANAFDGIKEVFSKDATRDMRDFNKYLELLPSYALLHLFQRPIITIREKHYVIPTVQDAIDAKATFDAVIETTKTGTDYRVLDFYFKVVADTRGLTAEDLTDLYNKTQKHHPKSVSRIREWLTRLEQIGYVDKREAERKNDKGYIDKRYNSYYPLKRKLSESTTILPIDIDLESVLKNSFDKWLKNVTAETDPLTRIIKLNINGTAQNLTLEEMQSIIIKKGSVNNTVTLSNINPTLNTEIEAKSTPIQQIPTLMHILKAYQIKRKAGVFCSSVGKGYDCSFEAEWNLNGNLYCETHFREQVKFNEENRVHVEIINPGEEFS